MANGRAALHSNGCAALLHERAAASERVANQRLGQASRGNNEAGREAAGPLSVANQRLGQASRGNNEAGREAAGPLSWASACTRVSLVGFASCQGCCRVLPRKARNDRRVLGSSSLLAQVAAAAGSAAFIHLARRLPVLPRAPSSGVSSRMRGGSPGDVAAAPRALCSGSGREAGTQSVRV